MLEHVQHRHDIVLSGELDLLQSSMMNREADFRWETIADVL